MAPNLHWPDTMFTFDKSTGVLFTCDAFGAHFCTEVQHRCPLPQLAFRSAQELVAFAC